MINNSKEGPVRFIVAFVCAILATAGTVHAQELRSRCVLGIHVPEYAQINVSPGMFVLVVFRKAQCFAIYNDSGSIAQQGEQEMWGPATTGAPGHETPLSRPHEGMRRIWMVSRDHYSNRYDARMPLALFYERERDPAIAVHYGNTAPKFASHGCVRLPMFAATALFNKVAPERIRIIVVEDSHALEMEWENRIFAPEEPVAKIVVFKAEPRRYAADDEDERPAYRKRRSADIFEDPLGLERFFGD